MAPDSTLARTGRFLSVVMRVFPFPDISDFEDENYGTVSASPLFI